MFILSKSLRKQIIARAKEILDSQEQKGDSLISEFTKTKITVLEKNDTNIPSEYLVIINDITVNEEPALVNKKIFFGN
ncbi:MAG: hypothetical protein NTX85_00785 [Candidatus Nomurabacteria bacterium]|nr:hypothetical protein [Candidatus Nomurabacteria bacterium]